MRGASSCSNQLTTLTPSQSLMRGASSDASRIHHLYLMRGASHDAWRIKMKLVLFQLQFRVLFNGHIYLSPTQIFILSINYVPHN